MLCCQSLFVVDGKERLRVVYAVFDKKKFMFEGGAVFLREG